jgi:hypothetical protein
MYKHWRYLPETTDVAYPGYAWRTPAFDEVLARVEGKADDSD